MTRKSERELERAIADLETLEDEPIQAFMWADLKAYYGGTLSTTERRLLEEPEKYL
jgi:hypothetical protein